MSQRRTLLVRTNPSSRKIEIDFGPPKAIRETAKDGQHRTKQTFMRDLVGCKTHMTALDVAWAVERHVPVDSPDRDKGGLGELLRKAVIIGAKNHQAILSSIKPKRRKVSVLD